MNVKQRYEQLQKLHPEQSVVLVKDMEEGSVPRRVVDLDKGKRQRGQIKYG